MKNTNNDLKNLNKDIENIRNKIENLEKDNKKILEKKIFEENVIINYNSQIFKTINEIDFILDQIVKQEKFKNRKIFLNLLFRGTVDEGSSHQFHYKCDKKPQLLIFIHTIKGEFLEDIQK